MALFHRATVNPTKAEMIGAWIPMQPWGPDPGVGVEPVGAFRFDDPEGRVGLETHLVRAGDVLFQVPLTYRDEPMVDDAGLIGEMEHSALGTRWVYDGLRDPRYLMMLAAVAMTGQGEAIGLVELDGRWQTSPSLVRIHGGGWPFERVAVDGFAIVDDVTLGAHVDTDTVLRNDRVELVVHRRPLAGARPPVSLTATWDGLDAPVVLATVSARR